MRRVCWLGDGHTRDIPGCLPMIQCNVSIRSNRRCDKKEGIRVHQRTVVAESLGGRADLYMIALSVRDIANKQQATRLPKLTSIVANVATLVARTTRQHHLRYSNPIVSRSVPALKLPTPRVMVVCHPSNSRVLSHKSQ